MLLSTFASSFIWGINTLFLLDAGLSITAAFAANAFFTLGQVIFEVPTGLVADTVGRRASYLLGCATLFGSTIMYLWLWQIGNAPFWLWAVSSVLLGLGFTFFSGATEAWLVDGLTHTGYKGTLEAAFAKGQIASGIAMLTGTISGGVIAQFTNLGVPYILRIVCLALTFIAAFILMHDVGFTPKRRESTVTEVSNTLKATFKYGLRNPPVRWLMLAAPFTAGVGFYGFYAMQPYLLQIYGHGQSYTIAALAAAIVGGAQIGGGFAVPLIRKAFKRRTSLLFAATLSSAVVLALIGLASNLAVVIILLAMWGMLFAATIPVRQAYINDLIPSKQRATLLSSDNLLSSAGAVGIQPALGKTADVWSYSVSYIISAGINMLALPFILLARSARASSDPIKVSLKPAPPPPDVPAGA